MSECEEEPRASQPKKAKKSRNCSAAEKNELEKWWNYFERNEEENIISCKVTDCKATLTRWRPYYIKRHFQTKHPSIFNELFPEIISKDKDYEVAAYELMFHSVEMVTVNGYPFSILDSSSLLGMLKRQNQDLAENGYKTTTNQQMITKKVAEFADIIRAEIALEVKGKMLSIMFDICTKLTLAVIGVSITFMANDEVIARSLGENLNLKFK